MSMFPGAGAQVYRNEAGEPTGWDYPDRDDPYDPDDFLPGYEPGDDDDHTTGGELEPEPEDVELPWGGPNGLAQVVDGHKIDVEIDELVEAEFVERFADGSVLVKVTMSFLVTQNPS